MKNLFTLILACTLSLAASGQHKETMNLNGNWEFEQTGQAFPPKKFSRTCPVPGLITSAEPEIEQYERLFPVQEKPPREWFGAGAAEGQYAEEEIERYEPRYNWYRKRVFIPAARKGREVVLTLKKSKYVTQAFVNGMDVGTSIACYTPIDFHITGAIEFGAENEILIKVGDYAWLPPEAAGSSDKEKIYYIPGIWDDVEISFTEKVRVHRCLVIPDLGGEKVTVKLQVQSFSPPQTATNAPRWDECTLDLAVIEKKTGRKVAGKEDIAFRAKRFNMVQLVEEIKMPGARLWSLEDPFLYQIVATVTHEGEVSDVYRDQFGMREFGRDGKYFTLNGERIFLRGTNVTLHRFFEDPECRQLPWDSTWVHGLLVHYPKQMHWNAMRVCVGIAPDKWYDIADEHGLLFQNEWLYWQERGWDEQIRREYTDWVWSDGNHPSIAIWDALNENWIPYIGNVVIPELQELDPSRIWDAGYMTAADMADDDMDEPHTYTVRGYIRNFAEHYDERPYQLGDLHDRTHISRTVYYTSSAAQLVNEYAWMWLWRNGKPAKLTIRNYEYYLGKDATPGQRRHLQAYWTQIESEWNRTERSFAGVLSFCYLTNDFGFTGDWFIDHVADLKPAPALHWQAHCFAPVATFIDLLDQRYTKHVDPYPPGQTISFNLVALNDMKQERADRTVLRLLDASGKEVSKQEFIIPVRAYGKQYVPVMLDLPETPGGYTLVSECYSDANEFRPVVSRRYLKVGDVSRWTWHEPDIRLLEEF